jgi:hypothetical protein
MPVRAGLTDVPIWQLLTAVGPMALAILGMVQVGGRLYRGAGLHTTGRATNPASLAPSEIVRSCSCLRNGSRRG